jgi:hypothetical protein
VVHACAKSGVVCMREPSLVCHHAAYARKHLVRIVCLTRRGWWVRGAADYFARAARKECRPGRLGFFFHCRTRPAPIKGPTRRGGRSGRTAPPRRGGGDRERERERERERASESESESESERRENSTEVNLGAKSETEAGKGGENEIERATSVGF